MARGSVKRRSEGIGKGGAHRCMRGNRFQWWGTRTERRPGFSLSLRNRWRRQRCWVGRRGTCSGDVAREMVNVSSVAMDWGRGEVGGAMGHGGRMVARQPSPGSVSGGGSGWWWGGGSSGGMEERRGRRGRAWRGEASGASGGSGRRSGMCGVELGRRWRCRLWWGEARGGLGKLETTRHAGMDFIAR